MSDVGPGPHVLARCADLAPVLAERAREAERLRRLPDATVGDAADAGLFDLLVPAEAGGAGLGLSTLADATRILAHGCVSSAWTLSFYALHNWLLSRVGGELAAEVFAERPWTLAPAPLAPTGSATPCDGGHRVSGRWEWATGVEHAEWALVHAIVEVPGAFETRFFALRRDEFEVVDVWHTAGMRATGSNVVVVSDVFVPSHRSAEREQVMGPTQRSAPGHDMAGHSAVSALALVAAAPALGAAESAVEGFRRRLADRVLAYTLAEKQSDQPAARVRLGSAIGEVRAGRATWDAALAVAERGARDGGPTVEERMDARVAALSTVRLSRNCISMVAEGSGASAYGLDQPLQRLQRDVEVLKGHVIFDPDRCSELAGRLALGMQPTPTDML